MTDLPNTDRIILAHNFIAKSKMILRRRGERRQCQRRERFDLAMK
jgi:hypothetical protein